MAPLENRFSHVAAPPSDVDGVIVLGGILSPWNSQGRPETAFNGSVERLHEFIQLIRQYPTAKAVFSGGGEPIQESGNKEADVVRTLMRDLDIDTRHIIFENASRNTFENVLFSKKLANPKEGETWILITSASHMPRAVGIFRAQDWNIIPWVVDYKTPSSGHGVWRPDFLRELSLLNEALHEYVGLFAYYMLGRTSEIFPGPTSSS